MSNVTITVSSAAELKAALSTASGGELILLNSGNYGNLSLKSNSGFDITFPSNVTIASANPAAPASFSGLDVNGAENLTFDGINFDYQFQSGDQLWTTPFSVENARNITITNSTFDGDEASGLTAADNGYGIGIGFGVYDSANITLTNNDISTFHRGLVVTRSSNTVVAGNEVHDIRSDGMNFVEVGTVLIENNYIHDFRASPTSDDHVDMIQFWTAGTNNPSENITIRGNILDIGQGNWTQSIFMGNEAVSAGAGANMFYQNVVIENNTIYNSHLHGISVFAANGLEIGNNTLVQVLDQDGSQSNNPTLWTPRINVGDSSVNVSVTGNAASAIDGNFNQAGWSMSGNAFIQNTNPDEPGYYGDVFIASSMVPDATGAHHFVPSPDGMISALGAGAGATDYDPGPITPPPVDPVDPVDPTPPPVDPVDPVDTTPPPVDPVDPTPPPVDPAQPPANGGSTGSQALTFDQASGGFYGYDLAGVQTPYQLAATALTSSATGAALKLGGSGTIAEVSHDALGAVFGTDAFSIDFSLTGTASTSNIGEIFRLHTVFMTRVKADGELLFDLYDSNHTMTRVVAEGVNMNDGAPHNITVTLAEGYLTISVDGNIADQREFSGTTADYGGHELTFGNPWGQTNFSGSLTAFDVARTASDYAMDQTPDSPSTDPVDPTPPTDPVDTTSPPVDPVDPVDPTQPTGPVELYNSATDIVLKRGVAETVDHALLKPLMGADNFDISFILDGADSRKNGGTLFSISDTMQCTINNRGRLAFEMIDENGNVSSVSGRRLDVDDGVPHNIAIKFEDGLLSLAVDGKIVATETVDGVVAGIGSEDLIFGTSGRGRDFSGTISHFSIDVDMGAGSSEASSHHAFAGLDHLFGVGIGEADLGIQVDPALQEFASSDRFDFLGDYVPPSDYFHA
jgi:parallel beta-helix repeat protein